MRWSGFLIAPLLLWSCAEEEGIQGPSASLLNTGVVDADQDGVPAEEDCDDTDADFFPTDSDGDGVKDFCGWMDLSAGGGHTCGVNSSGSVECWGWNEYGQSTPPSGTFESVSSGMWHTCGVDSSGSLECWGYNFHQQVSDTPAGP
jgi:hypothetical protein